MIMIQLLPKLSLSRYLVNRVWKYNKSGALSEEVQKVDVLLLFFLFSLFKISYFYAYTDIISPWNAKWKQMYMGVGRG